MIETALGLKLLLAIFQSFPILKAWFDELLALYIESEYQGMKDENKLAIEKSIKSKDQRPIEEIINPQHAGQASGDPGAKIIPHRNRG